MSKGKRNKRKSTGESNAAYGYSFAHISDLHFTSAMVWRPTDGNDEWVVRLSRLKSHLEEMKPEALFVTGDIAHNPLWELTKGSLEVAWDNAKMFLEDLARSLFKDQGDWEKRLFIIPGNHDAKILGNISRQELKQILAGTKTFKFVRGPLSWVTKKVLTKQGLGKYYDDISLTFDDKLLEALIRPGSETATFSSKFAKYMTSRKIPGRDVVVFCIDSNYPNDSVINFAQGAISPIVSDALRTTAAKFKEEMQDRYNFAYKIVLMHHHALPVSLTEGVGGVIEEDGFHLLRNAGNFLKVCHSDISADFILHGHKHAPGASIITFPKGEEGISEDHPLTVVGAGSVQAPFNGSCSYNLLRFDDKQEWILARYQFQTKKESVLLYQPLLPELRLTSQEQHRRRYLRGCKFPISAHSIDLNVSIDENGDMSAKYFVRGVESVGNGEVVKYPVLLATESKRATLIPKGFKDESDKPNVCAGNFNLRTPARQGHPQDIEYEIVGEGIYTFSKEHCRSYKGLNREQFVFSVQKIFRRLNIIINFPYEFPPLSADVEVIRPKSEDCDKSNRYNVDEWLERGWAEKDEPETRLCKKTFSYWEDSFRISFEANNPLPGAIYRICWDLPEDEYEVLNSTPDQGIRTKSAIEELVKVFNALPQASTERQCVQSFLIECGKHICETYNFPSEPLVKVDLAAQLPSSQPGNIRIVSQVQRYKSQWGEVPHDQTPINLGETLRGKVMLQREVRYLSPKSREVPKNPGRISTEAGVDYQLAIPLLHPAQPPYFPRIGVLTISVSGVDLANVDRFLEDLSVVAGYVQWVGQRFEALASSVSHPLPKIRTELNS